MTVAELDEKGRKQLRIEGGHTTEGGYADLHEKTSRSESLRSLHGSVHDEKITIRPETSKPNVLAGGLELDLTKDVEKQLE
jgi:hypothetical protein